MLSLYLVLIGLAAGLALDALIVRLAVPVDDDDEAVEGAANAAVEPAAPAGLRPEAQPEGRPSMHQEAGALVLPVSAGGGWARRLLVVGATAALFGAAGARYHDPSHLALVTAYIGVLLVCAATDLLAYRVPNLVTYPAIVGALVVGAAMPSADFVEVIAGGALAGGVLFLPAVFTGGVGMGMGDVKLAAFAGLALGFVQVVTAMVLMALAGGVASVLLLVSRRRRRGEPIPYAPFVAAGALATLLWRGTAFATLT